MKNTKCTVSICYNLTRSGLMRKTILAFAVAFVLACLPLHLLFAQGDESLLYLKVSESETSVAKSITDRPSVALILSGGGAKGLSYIPLIEAFEKNGIPIDKVFGTSIGSLIGGLYCAGYSPKDMLDLCKGNDLKNLFAELSSSGYKEVMGAFDYNTNNIASLTLGKSIGGTSGVLDDYMILNLFEQCLGNIPDDIDFNKDLVVPFECNAVDMENGREVVFSSGSMISALRASMSIPWVFEPVRTDEYAVLMEGGVVCNSMIHRAELEGFDIIICLTISGYEDQDFDLSLYDSMPGVVEGWMLVSFRNTTLASAPKADFWFGIDVNQYGILEFDKVDEIVQCGIKFMQDYPQMIEELAGSFSEEQKVYNDPQRIGEYFSRYPVRAKKEHLSSKENRTEDYLGKSRVSLGAYGNGGYGFDFQDPGSRTRRALFPTLSLRAFFNDFIDAPLSVDTRFKTTVGRSSHLTADILYCLNPDSNERFYVTVGSDASVGSLSHYTDIREAVSYNDIEYALSAKAGLMMTNGLDNILKVYASADHTWAYLDEEGISHLFVPYANVDFVFYPSYENGLFHMEGGRLDVLAKVGYDFDNSGFMYKLGVSGENTFKLSQRFSILIDVKAFTSNLPLALRDSYIDYGGWRGMPGYAYGTFCNEFINAGLALKWRLSHAILSDYLAFAVRGGVRSSHFFGSYSEHLDSQVPFGDCFNGLWDLGASVGYGFSTPVGDVLVGAGINKDLKFALYIELV